jgi:hypothetical protein
MTVLLLAESITCARSLPSHTPPKDAHMHLYTRPHASRAQAGQAARSSCQQRGAMLAARSIKAHMRVLHPRQQSKPGRCPGAAPPPTRSSMEPLPSEEDPPAASTTSASGAHS